MDDNRKVIKAARRRAARRRVWFRGLSFGAGVLVTLLVAFVFFRGQSDVTTSSQNVVSTPSAFALSATPAAVSTPTAQVTERPTNTPVPTLEPEDPVEIDTTTLEPFSKSSVVAASDDQEFSVKLNVDDRIEMKVGETGQLKAKLDPSDPSAALVWKSSDEGVIKVNKKGKVKAVGSGTATVGYGSTAMKSPLLMSKSGSTRSNGNRLCLDSQDRQEVSLEPELQQHEKTLEKLPKPTRLHTATDSAASAGKPITRPSASLT
jgi:hypothetical protein